jgi:hypothetical protein
MDALAASKRDSTPLRELLGIAVESPLSAEIADQINASPALQIGLARGVLAEDGSSESARTVLQLHAAPET